MGADASGPDDWNLTGREALARFAPEADQALRDLVATVGGTPELDSLARVACAETQGLPPVPPIGPTEPEPVAREYAEQFSVDVSALDDGLRQRMPEALGDSALAFVWSCYVADMAPRVRATLDALFRPDPDGWPIDDGVSASSAQDPAMEFVRVVHNLTGLDPVTSELVRLRGARQHNCRMCQSLRSRPALEAGAEEADFDAIDDYAASDLSARQKAALALTDAMIWQPGRLPAAGLDDVRAQLTAAEATELVLDVMRNAANKISVALGADAARVDQGYEVYEISADGRMRIG